MRPLSSWAQSVIRNPEWLSVAWKWPLFSWAKSVIRNPEWLSVAWKFRSYPNFLKHPPIDKTNKPYRHRPVHLGPPGKSQVWINKDSARNSNFLNCLQLSILTSCYFTCPGSYAVSWSRRRHHYFIILPGTTGGFHLQNCRYWPDSAVHGCFMFRTQ